jgi:hypothetical protein
LLLSILGLAVLGSFTIVESAQDRTVVPATPPEEVNVVASKGLEDWKEAAMREPGVFDLKGKEHLIAGAELKAPYIKYRLFREDIKPYLESEDLDPTSFAFLFAYVFPIYTDETYLGGLRVSRRTVRDRTEPGDVIRPYTLEGIDLWTEESNAKMSQVIDVASDDIKVMGLVQFRVTKTDDLIILESSQGRFFLSTKVVTESTKLDDRTLHLEASSLSGMRAVKSMLEERLLK